MARAEIVLMSTLSKDDMRKKSPKIIPVPTIAIRRP